MRLKLSSKMAAYFGAALFCAGLSGCATPPPADDPEAVAEFEQINDPLEPMNRAIFSFNQGVDTVVLRPVAKGYRAVVPEFGRDRISDILDNLKAPFVFANQVLQGNLDYAGVTLVRFVLNSTFGVLGIADVATPMGLPGRDADFGMTLAAWGAGEGPYLMLPILGPSNPRDGIGFAVDWFADPVDIYLSNHDAEWAVWTRAGVSGVVAREETLDLLDNLERTSLDYYAALRGVYRQNRARVIEDAIRARPEKTLPARP